MGRLDDVRSICVEPNGDIPLCPAFMLGKVTQQNILEILEKHNPYADREMARILEQLDESPEKVMYGKLLNELGNQSSERIRSAAKQVPLTVLRDLVYQFQQVIESRKGEQVETMAKELAKQGISAEELLNYLQKR